MNHLTDQELQAYLDGKFQDNQPDIENHISQCASCRNQLIAYQVVYKEARFEPLFSFSASFTDAVMGRITAKQNKLVNIKQSLLNISGMIIPGCIMLYFFIRYKVGVLLLGILQENLRYFSNQVRLLGEISGSSLMIFGIAGIILILIGQLDRLLLSARQNDALPSQ